MKHLVKTTTLLISAAFVAGCGETTTQDQTFDDMETASNALSLLYAGATARTDVPQAGTATYQGYVSGDLNDGRDLIGELELVANFQTTGVTGTADNFTDDNDQDFTGSLAFTGSIDYGATNVDEDSLVGFLDGDLFADSTTYDTSILLDGSEFYGGSGAETPDAIGGDASGLLDGPAADLLFDGGFIVEKP